TFPTPAGSGPVAQPPASGAGGTLAMPTPASVAGTPGTPSTRPPSSGGGPTPRPPSQADLPTSVAAATAGTLTIAGASITPPAPRSGRATILVVGAAVV